jgi:hypothetical protein
MAYELGKLYDADIAIRVLATHYKAACKYIKSI